MFPLKELQIVMGSHIEGGERIRNMGIPITLCILLKEAVTEENRLGSENLRMKVVLQLNILEEGEVTVRLGFYSSTLIEKFRLF
jgi:hypothetical protein